MSILDINRIFTPETFIAYTNLFKFNQFTFRRRFVVTPYSSPRSPILINSLSSNNSSGNIGSIPERVSYILTAPYILSISFGLKPRLHAL